MKLVLLLAAVPATLGGVVARDADCAQPWSSKAIYQAGTVVSFEGNNFKVNWYTTGTSPAGNGAFTSEGACNTPPPPTHTSSGVPLVNSNGFLFRAAPSTPGVIGYWPNWSRYSRPQGALANIDLSGITAVNYAFMNLMSDGSLKTFDSFADEKEFPNVAAARDTNPSVRMVLSIGGWSGSQYFSDVAASAAVTQTFVTNVHKFLDDNGFDGVDLDWEYPGGGGVLCNKVNPNDVANFASLLKTLREELGAQRLITITTSGETSRYFLNGVNYAVEYAKHVNSILVMTYDYYGAWSPFSSFNSALFPPGPNDPQEPTANKYKNGTLSMSIAGSMNDWASAGVPASQLAAGLGFYGRSWSVSAAGANNGLYQLCQKAGNTESNPTACDGVQGDSLDSLWCDPCNTCYHSGVWMYNNLRTQGPLSGPTTAGGGWSRKYIDFAQNPTLFDGKRFISYDDPVSIKAKAAWAKGQGLGGLLIWELSQDNAGELVAAVNAGWGSPVQPSPTSSTAATLTTSQVRSVVKTTTTTIISFPVTSASSTSPVEPAPVSSSTVITSPAAPSQTIPVMTHSATAPSTLTSVFTSVVISSVVSAPVASASPVAPVTRPNVGTQVIGGYLLLNPTEGPDKLRALAANAASLPINRVFLSFVRPDMVYVPDSNTLEFADIGYASSGDYGFAEVKNHIAQLQAGGVEVYMSMGGWNYNCYPYFYTKYSIGSFPTGNNYWKIQQYGGGSISGCNESNMWCYTCEPQSANTTLKDFIVFPEPENSDSWKAAQAYIVQNTKGNPVQWHPNMIGGAQFTDPVDGQTVTTVPGNNMWLVKNRNPYEDFVYLAKDLGLDGIDLDYEEMWHADTFRSGNLPGPFKLDQTVYKYTAIARNMQTAIQQIYSSCKLSTAAGAAGAWQGNWWGGNLKGLWYYSNLWFPAVTQFMSVGANAGGINVMSYDLSNNNQFFECPNTVDDCDLAGQVKFYMNTYAIANIPARVGYEIGQAAYPDPEIDPSHQIPLTQAALDAILFGVPSVTTQGGFFWELYKARNSLPTGPSGQPNNIDVTTLAQQICAKLFPNAARCKGVIPDFTVTPVVLSSTVVSHTASSAVVTSTLATTLSKRVQTSSSFSAPIIAPSSVPPSDVPVLIPSFGSSAVPSVTPVSSSVSSSAAPIKTTKVPVSVPASDCYPAWDASAAYFDAKNKVSYNGMNYVASWWTQGSNPSQNADGVWVNKGACGGIASSASSSGPRPVQTTASAGDCHPAWDASAIYSGSSNKASFNGFNYAATWWTQGSNPTENKDGVWIKTGPCGAAAPLVTSVAAPVVNGNCFDAYEPSVKYVGGSNVSYKGFNWQASWWQNAGWDPVSNKDGGWVKKDACGSSTIIQTSASVSASASTVPVPVPSSSTDAPAPVPQPEPSVSTSPASLSSSAETPKPTTTAIVGNTSSDVPKPAVTTSNASPAVSSTPIVPKPIQTTSDVTSAPTSLVVVPTTTGSSSGWSACGSVWSASQNYPVGTTVSIDKINYITKWYQNAGSNPTSNTDGGWSTVGACDPTLPIPSGPGGKPPVATNLAGARAYAASLSQDPTLLLLKNQVRTNPNIDGIHPGNSANPDNVKRVERIVTPTKWNVTYFSQADPAYTYTNFLKSVGFFTGFCDTYPGKNSDGICKRLLATMFAHFAQETGAHSKLLPIPEWQQSLVYLREMSCTENDTISGCYYNNDCGNPAFNKVFPCGKGPNNGYLAYFGRGAHQLSYSFNYGPFSQVIYNDPTVLLNNPALVADTWLNIASAIFFFIYPQPPKPSMLGVIDGSWIPNASDAAAGRTNDFPSTIQIINGECAGSSLSNAASNRISFYQSFAADMGLDTSKEAFKCSGMGAFDTSSAGVYPMYWTASYLNQNECQLVSYQTNFNALMDGPNYDQYVKCVQFSFNSTLA